MTDAPLPSSCPPCVRLDGIRLTLGRAILFDDLAFTAKAGRFTGLLGPSGVGKTTLLRLIAGLTPAIRRHRRRNRRPLTWRIAWMSQKDLLLPWLSVLENVRLEARLRGETSDTTPRALSLLKAVGLATRANDRPDTLSGGMRQRATLALLATMAILLHTVIGGILRHRLPWVHDTLDDPR